MGYVDRYPQVGIAPQFQDQMGGKMHDSMGVFRYLFGQNPNNTALTSAE
jgi:hypothetical protein